MENDSLLHLLHRILDAQEAILMRLDQAFPATGNSRGKLHDLIDSVDVMRMLNISSRTLHRLKASGQVATVKIGRRDYYSAPEIEGLINFFKK